MNKVITKNRVGLLAGLAIAASSAHAAIDTTGILAAITDAGTAVAAVGAAVLIVHVSGKVFKMIRAAM